MAYFAPQQHLREVPVEPKQTALLFVDVQNFNCHRGGAIYRHYSTEQLEGPEFQYFWARVEQVTPNWQRLQAGCRQVQVEVMYTVIQSLTKCGRDRSMDYKITGFHVPPGSWDAKVLECIKPDDDEMVIPKTSSSVFLSTNIDYILRSMDKKYLIICGCVTDQCVEHAVRDACDLGYYVTLVPDCCATYSQDRHDSALQAIKGYCRIRMLDELLDELRMFKGKAARGPVRAQLPPPVGVSPKITGIKHERSNVSAALSGLAMVPSDETPSGKRDRKVYFEYAKQSWEEEDEFKLPNNETWVEVHIKGDPATGERGLVYCKLCRSQERNNIFGKGYRAGKRSALREHMVTKDHKELVELLMRSVAAQQQSLPMLSVGANGLTDSPVMDPQQQQLQQQHAAQAAAAQMQHTPQAPGMVAAPPQAPPQLAHTPQPQMPHVQQAPPQIQHTPQSVELQHAQHAQHTPHPDLQPPMAMATPALVPE